MLDSTPLYDAVATMDTITLIRSAVRGLLAAADADLAAALRAVFSSGDDYTTAGKPQIDWDDSAAREVLIDSRARDGYALLTALDGRRVDAPVAQAAALLATVLGQDLEGGHDVFRIARRPAPDRVISTVDPQARHGHKTNHRGYDGFKGHIAIDPDSEIITATAVSAPRHQRRRLRGGPARRAADRPTRYIPSRQRPGGRLRGRRLRRRGTPYPPRPGHGRGESEGAKSSRPRRPFHQRRLHHRPGRRDRDLPSRPHQADPPDPRS